MKKIKPMLCSDAKEVFDNPDWLWENKFDGVRILSRVSSTGYELQARSGTTKTALFPELNLKTAYPVILDGEIICATGKFSDILHRVNRENNIKWAQENYPAIYQVFDLLEVEMPTGILDLRGKPLSFRKELLSKIVIASDNVKVSECYAGGKQLFSEAAMKDLEGVVGKRKTSLYQEGARGPNWLKVKCWKTGTFSVIGYTDGTGWREKIFGALVLADINGKYVGQVGTGFTDLTLQEVMAHFSPAPCALQSVPEKATWVKPFLIKVRYLEMTNDGVLRFPSFRGFVNE